MADIIDMKEKENNMATEPAEAAPAKKTFKERKAEFSRKHPRLVKGLKIAGGVLLFAGGAAVVKKFEDDKNAKRDQAESDRNALAEEWYQKGLLDAHKDDPDPVPDAVDVEVEPVEEETV